MTGACVAPWDVGGSVNTTLAWVGLALVTAAWLHYLWLIPQERVPERPMAHGALMLVGVGVGIAATAMGTPWMSLALLLALTLPFTAGFFWLLAQAALPPQTPTVAVGDVLRPFEAHTGAGEPWSSEALGGKRVLLTVCRGHW